MNDETGQYYVPDGTRTMVSSRIISANLLVLKTREFPVATLMMFYESLGFTFQYEKHGDGPAHFSSTIGNFVLEIYPAYDEAPTTKGLRFGFEVKDVGATMEIAIAMGATVKMWPAQQDGRGIHAVFVDPAGHIVEITSNS